MSSTLCLWTCGIICLSYMIIPLCAYTQTTIYYADFENTSGDNAWQMQDDASDGNWLIGAPNPYNTGSVTMEITAYEGNGDLLTGNEFIQDVDAGPTSARSPSISIPGGTTTIDFQYYFSCYTNSSAADYFTVELRDEETDLTLLTLVNEQGTSAGRNASWKLMSSDISGFSGQTVYIYVEAADLSNPSKVEASMDRIEIINTVSLRSNPCTIVISDDFETDLGNWDDPGSDCSLINDAAHASNGTFSVRIRDNTNTSMTTSTTVDLSTYDTIIVDFSFIARGMETNEHFWLQLSDDNGSTFSTINTWTAGMEFVNNVRYFESVRIPGPFTHMTRLRFRNNASNNNDRIYLDEIAVTGCVIPVTPGCPKIDLSLESICQGDILSIDGNPLSDSLVISHLWTDLGLGSASGYVLMNTDRQVVTLDGTNATAGIVHLGYSASTALCTTSDTVLIYINSNPACSIYSVSDTICLNELLMLDAESQFNVMPPSGSIIPVGSGSGLTETHLIRGVQDPSSVTVTITIPTWDDHFDTMMLNGQMIFPEVFQPASYDINGMNCQSPWNANVNGLPRSIIEITSTEVRYFSSLTTTSAAMTEVFPTNWTTTPRPFVEGDNTLQFGIQNTAGPVSGSWSIEAIGNLGSSFLWSTGDTTPQITVMPDSTTLYSVTVTSATGCTSSCDKTVYVQPPHIDSIGYAGCSGDGYTIMVEGNLYNESNPTDTIVITSPNSCDSLIYINLVFHQPPVVNAGGLPDPLCSNSVLPLSELMASISGSVTSGTWTTLGDGAFDNEGNFGGPTPATTYTPGTSDLANQMFILSLTSDDPPGSCEPEADAVMVLINDIECSQFPWTGN